MITSEKMRLFGKMDDHGNVTYTIEEYREIHICIQLLEERIQQMKDDIRAALKATEDEL